MNIVTHFYSFMLTFKLIAAMPVNQNRFEYFVQKREEIIRRVNNDSQDKKYNIEDVMKSSEYLKSSDTTSEIHMAKTQQVPKALGMKYVDDFYDLSHEAGLHNTVVPKDKIAIMRFGAKSENKTTTNTKGILRQANSNYDYLENDYISNEPSYSDEKGQVQYPDNYEDKDHPNKNISQLQANFNHNHKFKTKNKLNAAVPNKDYVNKQKVSKDNTDYLNPSEDKNTANEYSSYEDYYDSRYHDNTAIAFDNPAELRGHISVEETTLPPLPKSTQSTMIVWFAGNEPEEQKIPDTAKYCNPYSNCRAPFEEDNIDPEPYRNGKEGFLANINRYKGALSCFVTYGSQKEFWNSVFPQDIILFKTGVEGEDTIYGAPLPAYCSVRPFKLKWARKKPELTGLEYSLTAP